VYLAASVITSPQSLPAQARSGNPVLEHNETKVAEDLGCSLDPCRRCPVAANARIRRLLSALGPPEPPWRSPQGLIAYSVRLSLRPKPLHCDY
jgi:hypothetical protein